MTATHLYTYLAINKWKHLASVWCMNAWHLYDVLQWCGILAEPVYVMYQEVCMYVFVVSCFLASCFLASCFLVNQVYWGPIVNQKREYAEQCISRHIKRFVTIKRWGWIACKYGIERHDLHWCDFLFHIIWLICIVQAVMKIQNGTTHFSLVSSRKSLGTRLTSHGLLG